MTIRVSCPNPECGAVANVEEQSLGRRGRCKKCGQVFALARPGGEPASAISGDTSAWKGSPTSSARPTASPTDLPEQFGRYRIMKPLGQGGMGAVYLAHDTKLDRPVALKVPFFSAADGPQAIQRFEREARAAATLDHPNLCPVYDVGEVDGIHYLTMPYIKGKPLSEKMIRDQAITEFQAAAVARKLALAIQEAHARGIIHRDLKPANIMVNHRGEMVIMDFGLARAMGEDDAPITRTGHVLGTALYMAPEQAAGDVAAIGPGCDVYSLGVILYELLTGCRPFEGPWSLVIGLKNVKDPDPPSQHRPRLDPALDAICLKAIAREPKGRYATMAEFAGALNGYLARTSGPPPSSAPPPPGKAPAEKPESQAALVFAGLVSQEVTSLREKKSPPRPKLARPGGEPPRPPARSRTLVAVAGAAAVLLLGIIIYVATDYGRIKIEVNDPKAVVRVDDGKVGIEGLGEPITLRAGEHELSIKHGNGEFETRKFVVHRGGDEILKVGFEPKTKAIARAPRERPGVAAGQPRVPADDVAEFKPLFNGKDLAGWVTPEGKGLFTVEDGVILSKTDGKIPRNEFLVTDRPYADFVLKASVKIRTGNSGIQFRSRRAADGTVAGPQADIGEGYWGWFSEENGRGILERYPDEKAAMAAALVREGDWNDFVITARGEHVTISLNGSVINDRTDPAFEKSGVIALEVHTGPGTEVRFKDIEIKELSGEDANSKPGVSSGLRPEATEASAAYCRAGSGNWTMEGGELVQTSTDGASGLIFGDPSWGNYNIKVRAKTDQGKGDFLIRYHFIDDRNHQNLYLNERGISGLGTVVFGRVRREKANGNIPRLEWYEVEIRVRGPEATFFLNGEQLLHHSDKWLDKGRLGLVGLSPIPLLP